MLQVKKFGADWCGPCKMIAPTVKRLQEKYNVEGSNVEIQDINVDQDHDAAAEYQIRSIPALVFVKNGQIVERKVGVITESQIEQIIGENL